MKKIIIMLMILMLMVGCAKINPDIAFDGELEIIVEENIIEVPYNDIYKMEPTSTEVQAINGKGDTVKNSVEGVLLADILKKNNVDLKDYSSVVLESIDGYKVELPKEEFENKEIILTYIIDGKIIEKKNYL